MLSESSNFDEAPRISVVISTYDRPFALARCLSALLLQNRSHPFEILVVDNHPQSSLTSPLAAHFPSVHWLQEPIAGLSRARNRGIEAAQGSVIVTTDDDVIPPPDWLELLTSPLFATDGPAATTGNCLPLKVETKAEILFEAYGGLRHGDQPLGFDREWMSQWKLCFPQLWRIGTTANAAFRRDVLNDSRVERFDTSLGVGTASGAWEDLYCFYRILRAGYTISYLPQACLLHSHREEMEGLTRQLLAYRRGETAFLTMMLLRHGDVRALGQTFLWIPYWRLRILLGEAGRRLRGKRLFPMALLCRETLAYLAGPWAWLKTRKH